MRERGRTGHIIIFTKLYILHVLNLFILYKLKIVAGKLLKILKKNREINITLNLGFDYPINNTQL